MVRMEGLINYVNAHFFTSVLKGQGDMETHSVKLINRRRGRSLTSGVVVIPTAS